MGVLERIDKVEHLLRKRDDYSKAEEQLKSDLLTDYSRIDELYGLTVEYINQDPTLNPDSVNSRKKFCFVILYLYAPQSLCGMKMPKGLRQEISRVLGVRASNCVSAYCADLLFLYKHYRTFRNSVDNLLTYISIHKCMMNE